MIALSLKVLFLDDIWIQKQLLLGKMADTCWLRFLNQFVSKIVNIKINFPDIRFPQHQPTVKEFLLYVSI